MSIGQIQSYTFCVCNVYFGPHRRNYLKNKYNILKEYLVFPLVLENLVNGMLWKM